jgi:hypothetical protein
MWFCAPRNLQIEESYFVSRVIVPKHKRFVLPEEAVFQQSPRVLFAGFPVIAESFRECFGTITPSTKVAGAQKAKISCIYRGTAHKYYNSASIEPPLTLYTKSN